MGKSISIPVAVRQLLRIVDLLHAAYPKRHFTLDGRLVGDIGEIIVEGAYLVKLEEGMPKHYDGEAIGMGPVQIKATMKKSLTFPADHIPKYYLAIKIHGDGSFSEVFNGPGAIAHRAVAKRRKPKAGYHTVSIGKLATLNVGVPVSRRIRRRPRAKSKPVPLK